MRAGIDPKWRSPLAGVVRFDQALPSLLFGAINRFVLDFTRHGNPKGTFWLPFEAAPRTCIGTVASELSKLLPATEACAGVEWWVRSRPADVPMALHFDRDEALAGEASQIVHPAYSGVLYLTNEGGPTLILDQILAGDGQSHVPSEPDRVLVSPPLRNGFLAFPGQLRHGVLPDPGSSKEEGERTTLLLNWWPRKPAPPSCAEHPLEPFERREGELDSHRPLFRKLQESSLEELIRR